MKRAVLILLLLVNVLTYAQVSTNLVEVGKQWNVSWWYLSDGIDTYSYLISNEDTTYNEKVYYKLKFGHYSDYNSELEQWEIWRDIDLWLSEENGVVYALTSEDTSMNGSHMVQVKSSTTDLKEFVLYNFNLQIGDTIDYVTIDAGYWGIGFEQYRPYGPCYVVAIDTITTLDNIQRKRIILNHIDSDYYSDEWIEGIGSANGLLHAFLHRHSLLCVKNSDSLIYMPGGGCYKTRAGLEQVSDEAYFTIYPNPTTKDYINIVAEKYPIILSISDIQGKIISQNTYFQDSSIDLRDLPSGLYFVNSKEGRKKYKIIKIK